LNQRLPRAVNVIATRIYDHRTRLREIPHPTESLNTNPLHLGVSFIVDLVNGLSLGMYHDLLVDLHTFDVPELPSVAKRN